MGDFANLCAMAEESEQIETSDLTLMTAAVASLLVFESCQRPGAVTGATVEEWRKMKREQTSGS